MLKKEAFYFFFFFLAGSSSASLSLPSAAFFLFLAALGLTGFFPFFFFFFLPSSLISLSSSGADAFGFLVAFFLGVAFFEVLSAMAKPFLEGNSELNPKSNFSSFLKYSQSTLLLKYLVNGFFNS